jgi:hypothetical protein
MTPQTKSETELNQILLARSPRAIQQRQIGWKITDAASFLTARKNEQWRCRTTNGWAAATGNSEDKNWAETKRQPWKENPRVEAEANPPSLQKTEDLERRWSSGHEIEIATGGQDSWARTAGRRTSSWAGENSGGGKSEDFGGKNSKQNLSLARHGQKRTRLPIALGSKARERRAPDLTNAQKPDRRRNEIEERTKQNQAERNLRRRPNLWPRATEAMSEHRTEELRMNRSEEKHSLAMFSGAKQNGDQNQADLSETKNRNLRTKSHKQKHSA